MVEEACNSVNKSQLWIKRPSLCHWRHQPSRTDSSWNVQFLSAPPMLFT